MIMAAFLCDEKDCKWLVLRGSGCLGGAGGFRGSGSTGGSRHTGRSGHTGSRESGLRKIIYFLLGKFMTAFRTSGHASLYLDLFVASGAFWLGQVNGSGSKTHSIKSFPSQSHRARLARDFDVSINYYRYIRLNRELKNPTLFIR
jgi:hypothetical protein